MEFHKKISKLFGALQAEKHANYCWMLCVVRQETFMYKDKLFFKLWLGNSNRVKLGI